MRRIDEFRESWVARFGGTAPSGKARARIQSVGASCRLAGISRTDAEVRRILGQPAVDSEARQIHGYAAALDYPFPGPAEPLGPRCASEMHAVLMAGSLDSRSAGSDWRKVPCHREAFTAEGHATGRVFTTLPAYLVPVKIEEIFGELERRLAESAEHPVPAIAAFVMRLLSVSPFEAGNGRLGRLMLGHLLVRSGYGHVPYASIEREIEATREGYHDSFAAAETDLWTDDARLEPWIDYVVEVLERHCQRLEGRLRDAPTDGVPPLQRSILELARTHGTVSAGLLLEATGANRNTLKDNLRRLVERGFLERSGARRGTRYRLA